MAYTPTLYSGYKKFEYDPYSSQYADNISNLTQQIANTGDYQSQYSDKINQYASDIENFQYDPNTDPTYQIYKEQYTQNGKDAYKNTLAQLAARTGGNPSSYAQSNASQQYNYYMQELANKVPELRNLALSEKQNNLAMYQGLDNTAYSRYQDSLSNLYNQLGMYNTLDATDYSRYQDLLNLAYNQWQYDADVDYNNYTTAESARQQNYQNEWDAQQNALNRQASASGYEDQIQALMDEIAGLKAGSNNYYSQVSSMAGEYSTKAEQATVVNSAIKNGYITQSQGTQILSELTKRNASSSKTKNNGTSGANRYTK